MTPSKLTKEQISEYVKTGGVHCPYCGSDDMDQGPLQTDTGCAWCEVNCQACGADWQDSYRLVGILETYEYGDKK